ncbi:hypothetical protein Poly30_33850 [Planctomycetes bacterium Poly30]|uniref:Uncharacterized protein n=1 Tax=Saltatorellus ferox TaxID=2528018 RepID=A0A518EUS6_9BACT|nr:hypothetical protein Poly30_33850 [Planctomycetes bacterium Poly30]
MLVLELREETRKVGPDEILERRAAPRAPEDVRWMKVTRTPAMQAGLAQKRFNFRDIFTARYAAARFAIVRFRTVAYHEEPERVRCAA